MDRPGSVKLEIYDILGKSAVLLDEYCPAGYVVFPGGYRPGRTSFQVSISLAWRLMVLSNPQDDLVSNSINTGVGSSAPTASTGTASRPQHDICVTVSPWADRLLSGTRYPTRRVRESGRERRVGR
jgi:hypothetical protein